MSDLFLVAFFIGNVQIQVWRSGWNTGSLVGWERNEYGFGIPCRYPKAIGKYGFGPGMSVPNYPSIRGIAWYRRRLSAVHKFKPIFPSKAVTLVRRCCWPFEDKKTPIKKKHWYLNGTRAASRNTWWTPSDARDRPTVAYRPKISMGCHWSLWGTAGSVSMAAGQLQPWSAWSAAGCFT